MSRAIDNRRSVWRMGIPDVSSGDMGRGSSDGGTPSGSVLCPIGGDEDSGGGVWTTVANGLAMFSAVVLFLRFV